MKLYSFLIIALAISLGATLNGADCSLEGAETTFSTGSVTRYPTLQKALDFNNFNVTIKVGKGSEKEVIRIEKGENIRLISDCNATLGGIEISRAKALTITGINVSGSQIRPAIQFLGGARRSSNIKLENLKIEPNEFGQAIDGVSIQSQNENIVMKNVTIQNFSGSGIVIGDASALILIESSQILGQLNHGIAIEGNSEVTLRKNVIQGNGSLDSNDGFGIYVAPEVIAASLTATDNIVSFNVGKLANNLASDFNRTNAFKEMSGNKTTLGMENPAFYAVLPARPSLINEADLKSLETLPANEKNLLMLVSLMIDLSLQSVDVAADRYAYIRQQQAEECLKQEIGNRQFDEIRRLIEAFVGVEFEKLSKFMHRFDGIEKFDALERPTKELCEQIKAIGA